ncbi:MAG: hypothetical protein HUJ98_15235, partial [Bacteroidaceae bacterium]|nr:hypothetical protein [Bacteroidaceae bacterium]
AKAAPSKADAEPVNVLAGLIPTTISNHAYYCTSPENNPISDLTDGIKEGQSRFFAMSVSTPLQIIFELKDTYTLSSFNITTHDSMTRPIDYIEVSMDGETYDIVASNVAKEGGNVEIDATNAKYVRLRWDGSSNANGVFLQEIEAYGVPYTPEPGAVNVLAGLIPVTHHKIVETSPENNPITLLTDGDKDTSLGHFQQFFMGSEGYGNCEIIFTLDKAYTISKLTWTMFYASARTIEIVEVSMDGENYDIVAEDLDASGGTLEIDPVPAKYIRYRWTGKTLGPALGISELEAFGEPYEPEPAAENILLNLIPVTHHKIVETSPENNPITIMTDGDKNTQKFQQFFMGSEGYGN